jgi:hypothetical protein
MDPTLVTHALYNSAALTVEEAQLLHDQATKDKAVVALTLRETNALLVAQTVILRSKDPEGFYALNARDLLQDKN